MMTERYQILDSPIPPSWGRALTDRERRRLQQRGLRVPRNSIVRRVWGSERIGAVYANAGDGVFASLSISVETRSEGEGGKR